MYIPCGYFGIVVLSSRSSPLFALNITSPKQSAVITKALHEPLLSPKKKHSQTLGKERKEAIRGTQVQVLGIYKKHFLLDFTIYTYLHLPHQLEELSKII